MEANALAGASAVAGAAAVVWSWGFNMDGQLGHGDDRDRRSPTKLKKSRFIQDFKYSWANYR